ncbi:ABC transporter ATP-binding protein [Pseudomonas rhizoryzae]|uniref:ABC transporter ATP-binding protein n=1 Tax=Pseudomonas rhizoryzae TaxID=2571129 RepID=UPI00073624E6|nr:ABC transporter ATP-binding protein [Pseudomonas rhizoryzae]KTT35588.1 iron ABC transporter ATP-binding protein [Pseudomonas psychrotolerans]KTT71728.1 iron ABC transporter ATP-binding protein [Pseudomonas psychrotolerans]
MIRIHELALKRGERQVITGLSTELHAGRVHVILGPNGTGKTTLLRALAGDLPLAAGRIERGERRLIAGASARAQREGWRQGVAYMPQDSHAEAALSVLETVAMGSLERLTLHLDNDLLRRALGKLEELGIAHLASRQLGALSGGQRQLVFFAQVLMREPAVMLLDEPVSALDLRHQINLLDRVRHETRLHDRVTVVVLHDLNLACQYADSLLVLVDGGLLAAGAPASIVTADLLEATYGVAVDILHDRQGRPVVQPLAGQAFNEA